MDQPLRVLIVEDSEDDAVLLSRELRRGGYTVRSCCVDTAAALNDALDSEEWDVVLADYNMPQFSGLAALRVLQEKGKDIPFLVVSGFIDESIAVAAMKSGAHDYLMKDNLKRLVPAVERELREAQVRRERRQAAEALRSAEARLRQANDALLYLARSPAVQEGELAAAFHEITQIAGLSLGATRASIWLFDPGRQQLVCQILFVLPTNQHEEGLALTTANYPHYMAALNDYRFISTHEAQFDPRIKELAEIYLIPNAISASLQATVRLRGLVAGVFCLEQCHTNRRWTPEEEVFAGSVADLVSLALGADERRRAAEALRLSEQRYRDLFENANDMIYTMDLSGVITSINRRGEELTGYTREELLGTPLGRSLLSAEDTTITAAALQRKLLGETELTVYEANLLRKDGRRVPIEVNSRLIYDGDQPVGLQGIARDISERKRLEDELRHAQKMEAIGRLAGAIAHDFNNLLTAILGYSQLLLLRLDANSPWRREISEIDKAGRSAATLTGQLLAFSRKQEVKPQILNLNQVVGGIERMLRRLIGEDIELTTQLDDTLGNIKADPGRLEQVIMNLAVNSRDAMPKGGKLKLSTTNVYVDPVHASHHLDAKAGPHVMLTVTDTGVGMDHETQSRIFEPFFTTKELGKGTGLGLSTVYGIVRQSEGFIEVQSELGLGTTFRIFFPSVGAAPVPPTNPGNVDPGRGVETILMAEDDTAVRNLTRQVLELHGYKVLEARDAAEALAIARTYNGPIAALLTDVIMPQMNGPDLVRQVAMLRPQIRVVYMSGYADHQVLEAQSRDEAAVIVHKPFTPEALTRALRTVLDGAHSHRTSGATPANPPRGG
jgi:two-component system, cell cycle sensor histidine kinase and response regulator CckA